MCSFHFEKLRCHMYLHGSQIWHLAIVSCCLVCSDIGEIPANYVQLVNSQNMEQYE